MTHRKPTSGNPTLPSFLGVSVIAVVVAILLATVSAASAQESVPEDYGLVKRGESLYRVYCTSCHGATAEGDGGLAESLRVAPSNLTLLRQENDGEFPFERVQRKIDGREKVKEHGRSDMPVWGTVFTKVDETSSDKDVVDKVLALTHFIRSLQVVEAAP